MDGGRHSDVVEILNVDRLAHRIVAEAEGKQPGYVSDETLMDLWDSTIEEHGYDNFLPAFLHQEWEQVILAQDLRSRDDYFTAARSGRGHRLDRKDRAKVWKVVEAVTEQLTGRNQRTYLQIAASAAGYLSQETVKPYGHVIVDEAQDLHESQWRLLRAAVDVAPNDMFLVGDSHQRIYDRRSSLSKVGIKITGRSKRLRINYRTTHEILRWSLAVLGEGDFDDLDEGTDNHDVAGYHSFLHGPSPTTAGFKSRPEMVTALVDHVAKWITDGVDPNEIGITGRTRGSFLAIEQQLRSAGIRCFRLGKDLKIGEGVAIGTMHRLKGLEFRCVAVVDTDDESIPNRLTLTPASRDQTQHDHELRSERCLLYVACTRARDDLWVGWSGTPSRFIADLV